MIKLEDMTNTKNLIRTSITLNELLSDPDIVHFQKLKHLLIKLFLKKKILHSDLDLSYIEKKLLKAIITKKFNPAYDIKIEPKCLIKISKIKTNKKNEDGVKCVYKKALRELKKRFKNEYLDPKDREQIKSKKLSIYFYNHYFGSYYENLFLNSRSNESDKNNRILEFFEKKITIKFLKKLKVNREYIDLLIRYFENDFIQDFIKSNKSKIGNLIKKWEKLIYSEFDEEEGLEIIKKQINFRGNKIPWTLSESLKAMNYILNALRKL
jgi:hypothetical protein